MPGPSSQVKGRTEGGETFRLWSRALSVLVLATSYVFPLLGFPAMFGPSLKRAQRMGAGRGLLRTILVVGICSAILVPLLVLDLGLILQLLVRRGSQLDPLGWKLHSGWVGQLLGSLRFGDDSAGLLVLVSAIWGLALLETVSLVVLQRFVHRHVLRVSMAIRRALHDQTFVLGPHDLLGASRSRPEELFLERAEVMRRGLVLWWQAIPRSLVELGLLLLLALAVNIWLTLLAILLALYVLWIYRVLKGRNAAAAELWRSRAQQCSTRLVAALRLAPLATGYSLDRPPGGRFEETLEQLQKAEFQASASEISVKPLLLVIVLCCVSFVLLVATLSPEMAVAGTVLWGASLFSAYFPASRLYRLRDSLQAAEEAAADIFAYLDRRPGVTQVADAQPLDRIRREIKLDKVTIANRQGQRLLDNMSLTIPAGQCVAILASDPQTPMAVAGLFVRFYDPAAGRILYDEQDVSRATLDTVRGQAILVAADGPLFPGTIAENIACGETGFTSLQIGDALKQAQAEEFIRTLPEGLATIVGGPDASLRGDQAFRIGLARALLRQPSLLVIQEPEVQADEDTSRQLDTTLRDAAVGRTVVILPARLNTLRAADCIYLLHEGRLDAQGKHVDLLQTSELYRHLNYLRFNAFRGKVQ